MDRHIIAFGEYDKELHLALKLCVKLGMTCLDIGANIGAVSLHMSKLVGTSGRVHAFEPVPPIFERLIGNVKKNKLTDVIQAHQIALSNYDGTAEIRYADELTENQGMGSLVRREENILTMSVNVPTKTLDSFVAEHAVDNIDIIKMDVQGAEVFILEGGRKTLRDFSPDMFVEVSPIDLSYAGKNSKDLISSLSLLGYHSYEFCKGKIACRIQQDSINANYEVSNLMCSKRILQKGMTLSL